MKNFYLTLISNSSSDIFPSNKSSSFSVQFPRKIVLGEGCVVGLAEIQFSYNFFNVNEKNNTFTCIHGDYTYRGSITVGYYKSVYELVKEILNQTEKHLGQWLEVDSITNRIKVLRTDEIEAAHPKSKNIENKTRMFYFHGRLATQLGFPPDENVFVYDMSPYVGNVCFGIPEQMMLYCDLIEPQLIGYESSQIIKIVNTTDTRGEFGAPCYRNFQKIHYVPVLKKEFDTIEINIRDITGELFPFCHGIVMVKLHFKDKRISKH